MNLQDPKDADPSRQSGQNDVFQVLKKWPNKGTIKATSALLSLY